MPLISNPGNPQEGRMGSGNITGPYGPQGADIAGRQGGDSRRQRVARSGLAMVSLWFRYGFAMVYGSFDLPPPVAAVGTDRAAWLDVRPGSSFIGRHLCETFGRGFHKLAALCQLMPVFT